METEAVLVPAARVAALLLLFSPLRGRGEIGGEQIAGVLLVARQDDEVLPEMQVGRADRVGDQSRAVIVGAPMFAQVSFCQPAAALRIIDQLSAN